MIYTDIHWHMICQLVPTVSISSIKPGNCSSRGLRLWCPPACSSPGTSTMGQAFSFHGAWPMSALHADVNLWQMAIVLAIVWNWNFPQCFPFLCQLDKSCFLTFRLQKGPRSWMLLLYVKKMPKYANRLSDNIRNSQVVWEMWRTFSSIRLYPTQPFVCLHSRE